MKFNQKKIRNLTIGIITFCLLSSYSLKLIKGSNTAKKIVKEHKDDSYHLENIVAHRGFSGLFSDNSSEGIKYASDSECVDMIEIDISITKDKQLILYHDNLINIDDFTVKIEDLNLKDLDEDFIIKSYPSYPIEELLYDDTWFLLERFLNKSYKNEYIVKLEDFISSYSFSKTLILDIKASSVDYLFIEKLNKVLEQYKDYIYIQSDHYDFLIEMMKLYPDYKYIYIIKSETSIENMNNNFSGYAVKYNLLDKIEILPDKLYLVYTINSNKKYLNLLNYDYYQENMYIVTDNPDYICALSENKKLRK